MTAAVTATSQDLRAYLDGYAERNPEDVLVVRDRLSADQDVTALVWELAARGAAPLVRCHDVDGVGAEVVTNVFGSRERIARLFDAEVATLHDAFQAAASGLRPVRDVRQPDDVSWTRDVDLTTLPVIRHFANDRGPYITSAIVVADDPHTGVGNASYHRSVVDAPDRLATSLHSRGHLWRALRAAAEDGTPLAVAVVIGAHPLFMLAAAARAPAGVDERDLAGGLFGAPLEVVRTPLHGIAVPASAELVLEGHIDPSAHADEGPFGEFSGYSSGRSTNNAISVQAVRRRRDAVLLSVCGGNSAEHLNLGRLPREAELAARLKERFPDVVAIAYPASGTHFHCYVSVRQSMPGQARQVLLALLGWDPYVKVAIAVDEDVDVGDEQEVLWAVATRSQPHRDVFVVPGLPGSMLDPSSAGGETSRMGIDATRSPDFSGDRIVIADAARARARALLDRLGAEADA
jgi:UbiD family decarboxylase